MAALRRAGRGALVMPAMFAFGTQVLRNPTVATFAAFGSFALLLLVDFGGPMRARLQAQAALAATGAVFICVGTVVSRSPWLGALAMGLVGFGVLFAGVVSSVLASATVALLLAFILPVALPGPVSSIPDRLAGWGLASAASLAAISLLWPAPTREPLRGAAVTACRALAARLRTEARFLLGGAGAPSVDERDESIERADAAVAGLHRTFFQTPYRPTGLSTSARAVVRLVDEIGWLNAIVVQTPRSEEGLTVDGAACAVRAAAATMLERGADLLEEPSGPTAQLDRARAKLDDSLAALELTGAERLPPAGTADRVACVDSMRELVSALDPGFRAQELSFAASQIAANIELAAAAERRSWMERLLGRRPAGLVGPLASAQERAAAHVQRHSVWLHNSVRGAVGLALAVLVANLAGVQHSFWVVLGTLSVLRSNALSTGQNVVRGLVGTAAGFVVGAGLLALVGTDTTLLWWLLPVAVLFAGFAPAAISFAVGQAAFTLTLVILYNILEPSGWRVGLLRVEDIAIGCGVSLAVGVLLWPRGAAAALGQALADAYTHSARFLASAVRFGIGTCDTGSAPQPAPTDESVEAAAASRRLDDAYRGYLAERGAKPLPLAEVTGLVTGVAGLRLAAEAVLDLWRGAGVTPGADRAAARRELLAGADALTGWYEDFAAALSGDRSVPEPLEHDTAAERRLEEAVRTDLSSPDHAAGAVAIRLLWTGDHLDAARRLQLLLAAPAHKATERRALGRGPSLPWNVRRRPALRRAEARPGIGS